LLCLPGGKAIAIAIQQLPVGLLVSASGFKKSHQTTAIPLIDSFMQTHNTR